MIDIVKARTMSEAELVQALTDAKRDLWQDWPTRCCHQGEEVHRNLQGA